jgi:hypothetical protein
MIRPKGSSCISKADQPNPELETPLPELQTREPSLRFMLFFLAMLRLAIDPADFLEFSP